MPGRFRGETRDVGAQVARRGQNVEPRAAVKPWRPEKVTKTETETVPLRNQWWCNCHWLKQNVLLISYSLSSYFKPSHLFLWV